MPKMKNSSETFSVIFKHCAVVKKKRFNLLIEKPSLERRSFNTLSSDLLVVKYELSLKINGNQLNALWTCKRGVECASICFIRLFSSAAGCRVELPMVVISARMLFRDNNSPLKLMSLLAS